MKQYMIGEVSRFLKVKTHVIRYWEDEIPFIAPRKNNVGRRVYTKQNLQILFRVKHLLYENKYTIEGARKRLWAELNSRNLDMKSRIAEIRSDLLNIWSRVNTRLGDE